MNQDDLFKQIINLEDWIRPTRITDFEFSEENIGSNNWKKPGLILAQKPQLPGVILVFAAQSLQDQTSPATLQNPCHYKVYSFPKNDLLHYIRKFLLNRDPNLPEEAVKALSHLANRYENTR